MAARNAALASVSPSGTAPNAVTRKSRAGKTGGRMRARIPGSRDQGSALGAARRLGR